MGADWVKFRVRHNANANEVRQLASLVSKHYPHGRSIIQSPSYCDDDATRNIWWEAKSQFEGLVIFPKGNSLDYWSHVALTDPPGGNFEVAFGLKDRAEPALKDNDACRVYVISHIPIFPIEWRDEVYRIILPGELSAFVAKWRNFVDEVNTGHWRAYLHRLYLFDRVTDDFQLQEFENLVKFANASVTLTNAWCRKNRLPPVRDEIIQFNALECLKNFQDVANRPSFGDANRLATVSREQSEIEKTYLELCQRVATQIQEWNRIVPQKWKAKYPARISFDEYLTKANCNWLKGFFAWCDHLIKEEYGLYLWA